MEKENKWHREDSKEHIMIWSDHWMENVLKNEDLVEPNICPHCKYPKTTPYSMMVTCTCKYFLGSQTALGDPRGM